MSHAAPSGPRYRLPTSPEPSIAACAPAGSTFAVYLPDSLLDPIEDRLLDDDPEIQTVVCTREDEGIAIAMGAYLGGKLGVALMEGSGVGLSGLILARGLLQRTPVLLIVSHDRALGVQFDYHGATRLVAQGYARGAGYSHGAIARARNGRDCRARSLTRRSKASGSRWGLLVPRHLMIQS